MDKFSLPVPKGKDMENSKENINADVGLQRVNWELGDHLLNDLASSDRSKFCIELVDKEEPLFYINNKVK